MAKTTDIDIALAHKHFAAACFNEAWSLMDKADRSAAEDQLMALTTYASLYHWSHCPNVNDQNCSIGYWQASRVQALLGNAAEARRLGEICLSYSESLSPFYLGYAHEALARAASLGADAPAAARHLDAARAHAHSVADKDEREMLLGDIAKL